MSLKRIFNGFLFKAEKFKGETGALRVYSLTLCMYSCVLFETFFK